MRSRIQFMARDGAAAAAMLEAGDDRHVLAEITAEEDDPRDVRPLLELLAQQRRRAVAAAVVDEQHFVADAELVERGVEASEQQRQRLLFVVDRNDD